MTKTYMLLAAMTAIFGFIGFAVGGIGGMMIALIVACGMNLFAYWNSDKAVLKMYGAQPVSQNDAPDIYNMTYELVQNAHMPMPKLYVLHTDQPNAFATGRDPENAAVAVTTGLMRILSRDELAGVIAHELAHIKNRDTLIMTVTATIAGAIGMIANIAMFLPMFSSSDEDRPNPIAMMALAILAPMAAGIVQMAISRTREYDADRIGAEICGDPMALAGALEKIEMSVRGGHHNKEAEKNPATAHMFIINPLFGKKGMDNLFSTHPNTRNRIAALTDMAGQFKKPEPSTMSTFQKVDSKPKEKTPWG